MTVMQIPHISTYPSRTSDSMPRLHSALFTLHFALLLLPSSLCPQTSSAQEDPFALGVRNTPWLKPEEEQKKFKLPEGFEINLVAAEPEIQKPLNMQFDEKGRI